MGYEKRANREFWGFILYNSVQFPPQLSYIPFIIKGGKNTENNQLYLSEFLELKEIK